MKKYYAVRKGRNIGIYNTWDECLAEVKHFKDAEYKSFSTLEKAEEYLNDSETEEYLSNYAYVDGSYDSKTGCYSFGAVLVYEGKETRFSKKFGPDEYSEHRNVAGELKGSAFMITYAINRGIKELDIFYDYKGIKEWYEGNWKANHPLTKTYQEFAKDAKTKIKINFKKVKSHSNDKYNDIVDSLAKEALGIATKD